MDLFPEKKILTVSLLTRLIRDILEENFERFWVEGEISNLAQPSSGHLYFTLKDSGATIRCVMFRAAAKALRFTLADGIRVVLRGRITVYDQRGDYQIIAEYLEPQGLGALQLAFQQLKERLAGEGLFAETRKKTIPLLPQTIGIITSPTGAAIHDILNVIGRRHADLGISIYPVRVQGEGAAAEIATALHDMNVLGEAEVIILARGGGSLEDLWPFNEEIVARAVASSVIPVISAVGHEIDITIADLVADLRAPTPSAAAELVVNSKMQMVADCAALDRRLRSAMERRMDAATARLEVLQLSLKDPKILIERFMQRVDDLQQRSLSCVSGSLDSFERRIADAEDALVRNLPLLRIAGLNEQVNILSLRNMAAVRTRLDDAGSSFAVSAGRLESLSPLSVLARGYAVVRKFPGVRPVFSSRQLNTGDRLDLQFSDGSAICDVVKVDHDSPNSLDSRPARI
jgi:exodeoxyribonuclease VII large subunit